MPMKQIENNVEGISFSTNGVDDQHLEKQVLALDALSELTRQFASKPDFEELLNTILYTFSGQFGVGSCFISVRNPQTKGKNPVFSGIGKFKDNFSLQLLGTPEIEDEYFLKKTSSYRVDNIENDVKNLLAQKILEIGSLKVIVPLIHGGRLIGFIALGEKLKTAPFSDSELELMTSISNAITPLLVNSFLFNEIAALSNWYHEIINNVKQGVIVFDGERKLIGINEAGTEMIKSITGGKINKESISNQKLQEVFSDEYFQGWHGRIVDLLDGSEGDLIENAIAGEGELKKIFNIRATVIEREESSEGDLVITLDEITEQKQNEQRLFDLERLADKGMMAASISHELNNFLGLILAGVEMSLASIERNRNEDAETSLGKVKGNISKMIRYTTGLMDYTRLETNKQKANVNDIIEDVLSFVAVQRRFKSLSINTNLEGPMPILMLDSDQIAQLLMNLLNNAADAILEAKNESGKIKIATSIQDNSVVLRISDNGNGMTPEVKDKLFKKQLTTKSTGHGYGLVTCGKIVKNHNGRIEIVSQPGSGATFASHFPLIDSK